MFTVTFIIDNRIDFVRCFTEQILKHNLDVLKQLHAEIISIKNDRGETVNIELT